MCVCAGATVYSHVLRSRRQRRAECHPQAVPRKSRHSVLVAASLGDVGC